LSSLRKQGSYDRPLPSQGRLLLGKCIPHHTLRRIGSVVPLWFFLNPYVLKNVKINSMQKSEIITRDEALALSGELTFVTGVFDLIHLGHMRMLSKARNLNPDAKLVLAVLSDENVKERKGPLRPIIGLGERCEALSYLKPVDYIIPWEDDWRELREFVLELKPKILAVVEGDNGIDNKKMHIEKTGGKLIILRKEGEYSTSALIEKIKRL